MFGNPSFAENLGSGTLKDGFIGLGDYFDQASGSIRTADYAIDITNTSPVPEPSPLALLAPAVLLALFYRQRGTQRQRT